MQNANKPNFFKTHRKSILITLVLTVLVAVITIYLCNLSRNLAQEVANPIEQSLIRAGAVKKCSRGSGGRGPDNTYPWYVEYLAINKPEQEAIEIAKQAATDNGYNIVQATLQNRGTVGVADQFIDKWYYDTVKKESPFRELKQGNVDLNMTVNSSGSDGVCSGETLVMDATHSVISVRIYLPEFK